MSIGDTNPGGDKKKKAATAVVCLVAVALAGALLSFESGLWPRHAAGAGARRMPGGPMGAGGPGGRQMPGTGGQITVVSADAITIQGRDGVAKTFTLTPATKITVDRNPAAATDLKAGQRARVVSTDDKSASEVHIRTRPFGGPGGPSGRGGPGGRGGPPGGAPAPAVGVS